jgi:hypothetical protein
MANFRTESTEVESEFYGLVDGLRGLGPVNVKPAASTVEPPVLDSTTVEHLENLDRSIAQQRLEFAGKQDQLSNDVGQLREIVDKQARLFSAWIESTTNLKQDSASNDDVQQKSAEDDVLSDVFAQFKELSGADAPADKVSTI